MIEPTIDLLFTAVFFQHASKFFNSADRVRRERTRRRGDKHPLGRGASDGGGAERYHVDSELYVKGAVDVCVVDVANLFFYEPTDGSLIAAPSSRLPSKELSNSRVLAS